MKSYLMMLLIKLKETKKTKKMSKLIILAMRIKLKRLNLLIMQK